MPSEREIIDTLREIIALPKEFDGYPDWSRIGSGSRSDRLESVTGLRSPQGVTLEGLRLRANAPAEFYDRDITIQLELTRWAMRLHLVRLCFRPFAAHTNTRRELRHLPRRIEPGVSHAHSLEDNLRLGVEAFRAAKVDNLPAAAILSPAPRSVREFFAEMCNYMNVSDGADMPMPPWQGKLV